MAIESTFEKGLVALDIEIRSEAGVSYHSLTFDVDDVMTLYQNFQANPGQDWVLKDFDPYERRVAPVLDYTDGIISLVIFPGRGKRVPANHTIVLSRAASTMFMRELAKVMRFLYQQVPAEETPKKKPTGWEGYQEEEEYEPGEDEPEAEEESPSPVGSEASEAAGSEAGEAPEAEEETGEDEDETEEDEEDEE